MLLDDGGVDTTIKDDDGKTAEELAMEEGNYMIARMIRDHGSETQAKEARQVATIEEALTGEIKKFGLRKSSTI
jgi:ankyrin repeat protein